MASFNRVILLGNLTRDVEIRHLQSGMAVADVGLAVNDRRKSASGEWIEETSFIDVTLWGRTAEVASQYLSKGAPMLVEGRLKQETWDDKESGQKRSKIKVVCERMQMIGSKSGGSGGDGGGSGGESHDNASEYSEPASAGSGSYARSAPQDDIPF